VVKDTINLSIVVPCFDEEDCLREFHRRMSDACKVSHVTTYEIVYVNDGSSDGSLKIMRGLQQQDQCVRIIDLARNFGHQIALSAGLANARGAFVLTIDADLQDPPELLPGMIQKIKEGADVVYAQRNRRKGESLFKRITASVFYRILAHMADTKIPVDAGDFRLMTRRVVDELLRMPESHRFLRGLVAWIGFNQVSIGYDRDIRFSGETKYPFVKMLAFSLDAIMGFAPGLLRIVFVIAMVAMGMALLMMGWTLYSFFFLDVVPGWSSIMSVFLFFTSVQLLSLATIGEYVGRTFAESKRRPLYVIRAVYPAEVPISSNQGEE
jgi:glycosyltransferase involved in cell wall biosynthesis